jgi:hypothetical protein
MRRVLDIAGRLFRARPARVEADVVFYAMSWIDETWVRSTIAAACAKGLSCVAVIEGPADPEGKRLLEAMGCRIIDGAQRSALSSIDAPVVVSASSGITSGFFPESYRVRVHMPHSLVSLHMIYSADSFDGFDVLFAAGPHHVREFEALSRSRNLPARRTFEVGYGKADLFGEIPHVAAGGGRMVLVAPSWGPNGLMPRLGADLVRELLAAGLSVVLRPHPLLVLNSDPALTRVMEAFGDHPQFRFEHPESPPAAMAQADVLVTDYSGTAFEFAVMRKLPTVFVDVPLKEVNPGWRDLELEPIEIALRSRIGVVAPEDAGSAAQAAASLANSDSLAWRDRIGATLHDFLFRERGCGDAAATALIDLLATGRRAATA